MHSFPNVGSQGILQILPVLSGAAAITSKRWWMVRINAFDTFDNQLAWCLQYNLLYLHAIHDHMSSNMNRASRNDRKHINFPHTRAHALNTWNTIHHLWLCCNYRPRSKLHRTGSLIGCAVTPVPLNLLNNTLTHLHTFFFHINSATLFILKKESCGIGNTTNHVQHISNTLTGPCRNKGCVIAVISGSVQKKLHNALLHSCFAFTLLISRPGSVEALTQKHCYLYQSGPDM